MLCLWGAYGYRNARRLRGFVRWRAITSEGRGNRDIRGRGSRTYSCCRVRRSSVRVVGGAVPRRARLRSLTSLFGVFKSSAEVHVLFILFRARMYMYSLTGTLGVARSTVSRRLEVLGRGGLIGGQQRKGSVFCSLTSSRIQAVVGRKERRVRRGWSSIGM